MVLDSADKNKEVFKGYVGLWYVIKSEIETINEGKKDEYGKGFMKIKSDTDGNLPLNKTLKLHNMTVAIRSVFEEHGKFYP